MRKTPVNKAEYRVMGYRLDDKGIKLVKKTKSLNTADELAYSNSDYWIEKYVDGEYICNVKSYSEYEDDDYDDYQYQ